MNISLTTKFITDIFSKNETAKEFKTDFIDAIITWIKPIFLKEDKKLVEQLEENAQAKKTQQRLKLNLEELLENIEFKTKLKQFIVNQIKNLLKEKP